MGILFRFDPGNKGLSKYFAKRILTKAYFFESIFPKGYLLEGLVLKRSAYKTNFLYLIEFFYKRKT